MKDNKENILKITTGKSFNVLVALLKNGKVCELKEFDRRDFFYDSMLSIYSRMGYQMEIFILDDKNNKEDISNISKNNNQSHNRVYCRETRETWDSVKECSIDTGIGEKSILSSIYRGRKVFGKRFSIIPPKRDDTTCS